MYLHLYFLKKNKAFADDEGLEAIYPIESGQVKISLPSQEKNIAIFH